MSLLADAYALGKGQAQNLRQVLRGRPLRPASFVSMTLDPDDVAIAERFLANPADADSRALVEEFESGFAKWSGAPSAFAFASGRESLHAALSALGIGPGDEILLPAFTCVVVPNACRATGAQLVWADIELETFGLDVADVERRLTPRTRVILLQHVFGLVCRDYAALLELAARRGLLVVEDCAHSAGARWRGVSVGLRADAAFFSSEHTKSFNTILGGVAMARDPAVSERLASLAERAPAVDARQIEACLRELIAEYWQHKAPNAWWRGSIERARAGAGPEHLSEPEKRGEWPANFGRRLPEALAAVGTNQLAKLDAYNERRRATARRWDAWCARHGYARPLVLAESMPTFLRYPVLVEPERKRKGAWGYAEFGTKPGTWFTSHTHPVPSQLSGFPRADDAVARCINLPCILPAE